MTKLSGIVVRKEMRRLPFAFETPRDLTARSYTTMVSLVSGYEKKEKEKTLNTNAYSIRGRSISIEPGIEQWRLLRTFSAIYIATFEYAEKNGYRTPWSHKTMYFLIIRWFISFDVINSWNL